MIVRKDQHLPDLAGMPHAVLCDFKLSRASCIWLNEGCGGRRTEGGVGSKEAAVVGVGMGGFTAGGAPWRAAAVGEAGCRVCREASPGEAC